MPAPRPQRPAFPSACDEPLPVALSGLLARRGLSVSALGSLLRAEGIAISRARLHQLASGSGAAPTAEQLERLASVLGVSPGYFAEYRLWRVRSMIDPAVVGFDRAMANYERLRGRRDLPPPEEGEPGARYPAPLRRASKERA
jgi:transcriptional regulator with XRE-family HTH domain